MGKNAQITLYVIAGLVFLIIAGFFFSGILSNGEIISAPGGTLRFSRDMIEKKIDDCLHDIIVDKIDESGLCSEKPFEDAINSELFSCINVSNLRKDGVLIAMKSKPQALDVIIRIEDIYVSLDYPIYLKKDDKVVEFENRDYQFLRTRNLDLNLDSSGKTRDELFLLSPDLDLELKIPRSTKVIGANRISLYLKEICPDDPSVLGKIKYEFRPEKITFDPNAILTIRYEDKDVSQLSREESFKLAYLEKDHWELLESTADTDRNKIQATTTHLSDWVASCSGTNKYGMELMLSDLVDSGIQPNVDSNLACSANFSGPCGYAKIKVYVDPLTDNYLDFYEEIINRTYDQHLIPVLTLTPYAPPKDGRATNFLAHPGTCDGVPNFCKYPEYLTKDVNCGAYSLDCVYGENVDGSEKPEYNYGNKDTERSAVEMTLKLLDRVHKEKPNWPLYIELGDEPNLAMKWHDVSLTDYEINEYANYYVAVSRAIKEDLDIYSGVAHSGSIKLMPAGLAPTKGAKECGLTPQYAKEFHSELENYHLFENSDAYLEKIDCEKLGSNYITGENNLCAGSIEQYLAPACPTVGDCKVESTTGCPAGQEVTHQDVADCLCPSKRAYVTMIKGWYDNYAALNLQHAFLDLDTEYTSLQDYVCDATNYASNIGIENALLIKNRIENTFQKYCYEKITEVSPDDFLTALLAFNDNEVCNYMDLYADHSYPESTSLSTYPGGENPYGALAYQSRFSIVTASCANFMDLECVATETSDTDSDGIPDYKDNCPNLPNPGQEDWDLWSGEGKGDVCDDSDGDGTMDFEDACPTDAQITTPSDMTDTDEDLLPDVCDNCINVFNPDQADRNGDSIGDICQDLDSDGIPEILPETICKQADIGGQGCIIDNCPTITNADQYDEDSDGVGNACDNCQNFPNPQQTDADNDGEGYPCDENDFDVCPNTPGIQLDVTECPAEELCKGKIMLTQAAWAPHPKAIYTSKLDFSVDDYVPQMEQAYQQWLRDKKVLGIIAFHIGDDVMTPPELRNYSWTKEMCSGSCVGKEIFNVISKKENPLESCSGNFSSCTTGEHQVLIQNLGREVGKNRIVYTCLPCGQESASGLSEQVFQAGPIEYVYRGIKECFEEKGTVAGEHGGLEIPEFCPDGDGTVREGIPCSNVTIDGTAYVGLIRCEPSFTSNLGWFHKCGTVEQCNGQSCCKAWGDYGHYYHSCEDVGDVSVSCTTDEECELGKVCVDSKCVSENNVCIPACQDGEECNNGVCAETCTPTCEESEECVGGECLPDICSPVCEGTQTCINGECKDVCTPECGGRQVCASGDCYECASNSDCDYTKICEDNICIEPTCQFDSDCGPGKFCDVGVCKDICLGEGELIPAMSNPPECCGGLRKIDPPQEYINWILGICTVNCGDGTCDSNQESYYNCAEDCT
ncbi:MAG: thrombospondin type 3 repeat-containing protein [archaeon]